MEGQRLENWNQRWRRFGRRMRRFLLLPAGETFTEAPDPENGSFPAGREEPAGDNRVEAGAPDPSLAALSRKLKVAVAELQDEMEGDPSILDWNSGLNLSALLPRLAVCAPPATDNAGRILPYLDRSIDIVVTSSTDPDCLAEARRVATVAVIRTTRGPSAGMNRMGENKSECRLDVERRAEPANAPLLPTASIIIPVYNKVRYTESCLERLVETLPRGFTGEIIVVDDASWDETAAVLESWTTKDERIKVLCNPENRGFIRSCNRGAAAAGGEILVFLNNDTLPLPGWLQPLLRTLRDRPDAGAVGGKLLHPDGKLQEAGGVVFRDGSACNFGKHDRAANAPLYSFLREVDYCSGALLATRRVLFMEAGGFDTRFEPAYYEDTDYCFTLRQKGYRVYYQPESAIVHFEGVSSGTDPHAGVKRYQTVNHRKFVEKWRAALAHQPPVPARYDFDILHALSIRGAAASVHVD